MKIKELKERLKKDGWYLIRTKGSHERWKHPTKTSFVTIAGKLNDDIAPGTLNSILKQAGFKK